jgi:hypothetical protein
MASNFPRIYYPPSPSLSSRSYQRQTYDHRAACPTVLAHQAEPPLDGGRSPSSQSAGPNISSLVHSAHLEKDKRYTKVSFAPWITQIGTMTLFGSCSNVCIILNIFIFPFGLNRRGRYACCSVQSRSSQISGVGSEAVRILPGWMPLI